MQERSGKMPTDLDSDAGGRTDVYEVHLDHFTYGWINPGLAYALSFLGSLLGLVSTSRARSSTSHKERARWLLLAAWAIGGTGIWVMHFMAMLGFTAASMPIRYDVPMTIASWITAIVVVGIGLFIVGFGRPSVLKIIVAGVLTGLGVAGMHYTGMYAMRLAGEIHYDRNTVIASVVIAVVAATVALWFTVTLRRGIAITIAAAIMGVAVNGMHYTGMFAMSVVESVKFKPIVGITPLTFLSPIVVFVVLVTITLFYALLNRPTAETPADQIMVPPQPQPSASGTPSAFEPRQPAGQNPPNRRPSTYVRSSR
jgi:NO-binding membrane sensor protein with MHYT domain